MSLKLQKAQDLAAYSQAVLAASGIGTAGTVYGNTSNSGPNSSILYLQSRDALYTSGMLSLAIGNPEHRVLFRVDPELRLGAGRALAHNVFGDWTIITTPPARWLQGSFDPQTSTQPLYCASDFGEHLRSINPDTLVPSGANPFIGPNGEFNLNVSLGLGAGLEGAWTTNAVQGMFFQGLTDGVPGETVVTGPNVFPWGLYWAPCGGTLNGTSFVNGWGWIDIYRSRLVGLPGGLPPQAFPAFASASPGTSPHPEPPIAGDAIAWRLGGFIQDPDGTPQAPKGELFFHGSTLLNFSVNPAPGQIGRMYVRWSDLNPFHRPSAAGVPARTHGRIRLTSRLLVPLNPQFNIPGQLANRNAGAAASVAWDPQRRRAMMTAHYENTANTGLAAKHSIGWYTRAVDPVILSAPAARSVPRTADVVRYDSFVGGDLGEPAAGQRVNFSLTRRSSEGELVTVAGGAGSSSPLANPPIDTDPAGVPELALVADGVPLALGVDYTVVAATGVLTWVTSQAGRTVLATYKHRQSGAVPPHGTLLLASGQADEYGRVRTEVSYPDDDALVGTIDALESTLG